MAQDMITDDVKTSMTARGPMNESHQGRSPGPYEPGSSWSTWMQLFMVHQIGEKRENRLEAEATHVESGSGSSPIKQLEVIENVANDRGRSEAEATHVESGSGWSPIKQREMIESLIEMMAESDKGMSKAEATHVESGSGWSPIKQRKMIESLIERMAHRDSHDGMRMAEATHVESGSGWSPIKQREMTYAQIVQRNSQRIEQRNDSTDDIAKLKEPEMNSINPKCPPIMLEIEMNGVKTACELDTGAGCSIIDARTWRDVGEPTLRPATTKAWAYNGTQIPFMGKCRVNIDFEGKRSALDVNVIDRVGHNLCGRDMIVALEIDIGAQFYGKRAEKVQKISQTNTVEEILEANKELFLPGLGQCRTMRASLKLKEGREEPSFKPARTVPYAARPKVEEKLNEMVRNGTLIPVQHSDWATPLVIVPKPGGKIRICGDYKVTVNPKLDINQYPLPIPADLFHQLNGGQKFSKMDLSDAYMQIPLDERSRKYTTINTSKGLFEYTSIPFGIASAPAIFQHIMERTLAGIEGVVIYLDDITVTGPDDNTHLERLEKVLERLRTAGFRLKREKCEFLKEEIQFLGHVVNAKGIKPSPEKIRAMINMPEPKNVKGIESFIGMVQYYAKFIPNLSTLAAPINALRKKDTPWKWGREQKEAFEQIKKKLTEANMLAHYDPKVPVVLATDASEYGIGAVIYHKYEDGLEKVIAYASRTLTASERNYAQIEKEALGIVFGVEKFSQYLYGRKFTLLTDHQPLVTIFGPKSSLPVIAAKRLHRWALKLMAYSFDIEYRNTKEFGNADGLSRLPDPRELPTAEAVVFEISQQQNESRIIRECPLTEESVAEETAKDSILQQVMEYVRKGWPDKIRDQQITPFAKKQCEISERKGILIWQNRVIIPHRLRRQVLEMLHVTHFGRNKMIALARSKIWFPNIDLEIDKIAKSCSTCAAFGNDPRRTTLHPWEEPSKPWQRIHMDFCETNNKERWLVVVDAKSKWPEVVKMNSTTAEKLIEKVQALFATHGLPEQIVSDNGPQFSSKAFKEYCRSRNIELTLTPPYHPNSNGEAERFVQTFKQGLYKSIRTGLAGEKAANAVLFQYRVTPHIATGLSPAEVLMGRKLRTSLDIEKTPRGMVPMNKYRERMADNYPGKAKIIEYRIGQEVYIRNYSNSGDKWVPGIVTKKHSPTTYEVHYGNGRRKTHVDQMKKRITFWDYHDSTHKTKPRNNDVVRGRIGSPIPRELRKRERRSRSEELREHTRRLDTQKQKLLPKRDHRSASEDRRLHTQRLDTRRLKLERKRERQYGEQEENREITRRLDTQKQKLSRKRERVEIPLEQLRRSERIKLKMADQPKKGRTEQMDPRGNDDRISHVPDDEDDNELAEINLVRIESMTPLGEDVGELRVERGHRIGKPANLLQKLRSRGGGCSCSGGAGMCSNFTARPGRRRTIQHRTRQLYITKNEPTPWSCTFRISEREHRRSLGEELGFVLFYEEVAEQRDGKKNEAEYTDTHSTTPLYI